MDARDGGRFPPRRTAAGFSARPAREGSPDLPDGAVLAGIKPAAPRGHQDAANVLFKSLQARLSGRPTLRRAMTRNLLGGGPPRGWYIRRDPEPPTTGPCLREAFEVMDRWGFRYSAIAFTWVKLKRSYDAKHLRVLPLADFDLHVGLGLTTRKNAEFCLLGRRGSARRNAKDVREIILAPVREHCRKPDEAYDRVQRYCDGPYLELFARASRPGWTTWGNERTEFDAETRMTRFLPP